jgi:hypothetical protein
MTEQLPQAPTYHEPDRPVARVTVYDPPSMGFSPGDLTELGAQLASTGMTSLEVRALMSEIQQVAAQSAALMAPKILERIRSIHTARLMEIYTKIRLLPNAMGYVQRDRVIAIVQEVMNRVPRS